MAHTRRTRGRHQGKTTYFRTQELHTALLAAKSKVSTQIAISGFAFTGIVAVATATTAAQAPDQSVLTAHGETTVLPSVDEVTESEEQVVETAATVPARDDSEIAVIQAAELVSQVRALGDAADPELTKAAEELELLATGLHAGLSVEQERGGAASRSTQRTDAAEASTPESDAAEQDETTDASTPETAELASDEVSDAPAEEQEQEPVAEPVSVDQVTAASAELDELLTLATTVEVTTVAEQRAAEFDVEWAAAVELADSTASYGNGRIPLSALRAVDTAPGHYLRADAAVMFGLMNEAFREQFGHNIGMTDSYRSYSAQVATKAAKGFWAATPGTSNHGWGVAIDLSGAAAQWGTAERNWLVKNGATYGWISPGWAQPGAGKEEPWHWEYEGASGDSIPQGITGS
ncbi:M15 family metallopeptidase [Jonesia quinghaiensis]|uniref:M15 family metallopeptidase n=1 Tax=Jonesia quinghaiensis TaxID=262806 RepID=UPI0003FEE1BC|nr:M15 family metallopeptidase [Jonesia quinghaiensis]